MTQPFDTTAITPAASGATTAPDAPTPVAVADTTPVATPPVAPTPLPVVVPPADTPAPSLTAAQVAEIVAAVKASQLTAAITAQPAPVEDTYKPIATAPTANGELSTDGTTTRYVELTGSGIIREVEGNVLDGASKTAYLLGL